jgi:hypothetical protein
LEYHYFIGVGIKSIRSANAGQKYVDCIVCLSREEFETLEFFQNMIKNKLWKLTKEDKTKWLDKNNVSVAVSGLYVMRMRSVVQELIIYHFNSEFPLEREELEITIKYMDKEKLEQAKVR